MPDDVRQKIILEMAADTKNAAKGIDRVAELLEEMADAAKKAGEETKDAVEEPQSALKDLIDGIGSAGTAFL